VQIVGAARNRFAVEPDVTLIGLAIVVGVGEFPDMRRRADIDAAAMPEDASGNIILSAKTVALSKTPLPLVSSRRMMRCVGFLSWTSGFSFEPDESATYSRPRSSKDATMGRSTRGGPATRSIVKPTGNVKVCPSS